MHSSISRFEFKENMKVKKNLQNLEICIIGYKVKETQSKLIFRWKVKIKETIKIYCQKIKAKNIKLPFLIAIQHNEIEQ